MIESKDIILSVHDVEISFGMRGKYSKVIRKCSLDLYKGEVLVIVGESGSGKSVLTKSFLGMLDANGRITGGSILFHEKDLAKCHGDKEWRAVRGKKISMVLQDPMTSLNPLKTVGKQIQESIVHNTTLSRREAKQKTISLMERVGIENAEYRYHSYPHEFSGGMRQRVVIAAAVACEPEILICDEPTTALDVTMQAQILDLIRQLKNEMNMTVIFITHDLGVAAGIADRIAVMYAGQIVEYGTADEIFYDAWHPYTWALLSAMPQFGKKGQELPAIEGTPPRLLDEITGDAFAPRNKQALVIDFEEEPPYFDISGTHKAKTWYLDPRAPKVERPPILELLRAEG